MASYETLLLLSPELGEEGRKEIVEKVSGIIANQGGELTETDEWGMRPLAYPVQKQSRGYYVRLVFNAPGALIAEMERIIRITDGIFKFITVKQAA
ncbi:30S ribosomal protein S6 [Salidesulfovibrio brasiliensis]|uniref:30S ribosomal protein S6 n=1 Tax=Salidesulfovibrio brasiliensis TaxID=221711 RepID=UPI0006D1318D|nr:30S ribosomal protein S6 [Salidesulfovibrio brasiliensis]